jgi:hypothetical protein
MTAFQDEMEKFCISVESGSEPNETKVQIKYIPKGLCTYIFPGRILCDRVEQLNLTVRICARVLGNEGFAQLIGESCKLSTN